MKILFVVPKYDIIPVGVAYICAVLKQAGHAVDCFISDNNCDELTAILVRNKYEVVATGGLSIQYNALKTVSNIVKKFDVLFIVGGGIVTSEPELICRALKVDYGIMGEGEETIVDLLSCIIRNGDLSQVNGIGYFSGKDFVITAPRKPINDLNALPLPDYESIGFAQYLETLRPSSQPYFDIFDYPREYPILTSRSCPFLCTFCYHPIGNKYRLRSIDSIMAELEMVIPKYRINIVSIYDELFSHDMKRVHEFCERFKRLSKTLSREIKWLCQLRVDGLKDGLLNEMRSAGCFCVSYGFESYSPIVLKSMKKYILPEQIHHAYHATLENGLSLQANFIFGDRAETLLTAKTTLDFWKEHTEPSMYFIIAAPNSDMYQYAVEKGIIRDKVDFMANHMHSIINMTEMSEKDFVKLKKIVFGYYDMYAPLSIPLKLTDSSITIRCPRCKKVTMYNNFDTSASTQRFYCRKCRRRFDSYNRAYLRTSSPLVNGTYFLLYRACILLFTEKILVAIIRARKNRFMRLLLDGVSALKRSLDMVTNFNKKFSQNR